MKRNVKIHIGQLYASHQPLIISTILGSCVSVCLFDPVTRSGGMNHILHTGKGLDSLSDSARFGINAMEKLINELVSFGSVRKRLVAKVFGGGNMLGFSKEKQQGSRNVAFVLEFLKTDGIRVAGQSTGGRFSRKLFFHTDTSEVLLKKTGAKVDIESAKREKQSFARVKSISDKAGEITLF